MTTTKSPPERPPRKTKKREATPRYVAIIIVIFIVMVTGAGLGFLTASIHSAPTLTGDFRPAVSSQIFDIHGKLITTIHSVENRLPVPLNKIPKDLQNAFLAAEDIRFYQHFGIDLRGIARALVSNISVGGVSEGASTITQQLAKNTLLTQDRTLKRKIQEAVLALQIERQYSKQEIFELYLNQIYFGSGAYGVQAAAQVYFGKNVEDLTLGECAILAGIPKSPNYYSPFSNQKAAKERQLTVLEQMVKYKFIDQTTAASVGKAELKLAKPSGSAAVASYFIDYVTQTLINKYGADAVYKDGLKIYTTLDLDLQRAAEQVVLAKLPTNKGKDAKQPQGALVCIDPHTGHIKAMVGGRGDDQFNRAVLAERQPGSAFKPFVYLAALESGMTAATVIDDKQISYGNWTPRNYSRKFNGPTTLRVALEQSLNGVTVQLAQKVGPEKVLHYAEKMGISTLVWRGSINDQTLSMSLGGLSRGVTPLEIASAFGVLANQGVRLEPMAIVKVIGRNNQLLEENRPQGKAVLNDRTAYLLTDMLKGVVQRGTGAGANIGRPAAGKTGTTDDYNDAWFIGYTPDLVTSVWMGYDDNTKLNGITGGTYPAVIWREFMKTAVSKTPARDFARPNGLVTAHVAADGLLANDPADKDSRSEIFIKGTQPTTISTQNQTPPPPDPTPTPQQPGDMSVQEKYPIPPPPYVAKPAEESTLPPVPPPANSSAQPN